MRFDLEVLETSTSSFNYRVTLGDEQFFLDGDEHVLVYRDDRSAMLTTSDDHECCECEGDKDTPDKRAKFVLYELIRGEEDRCVVAYYCDQHFKKKTRELSTAQAERTLISSKH
jgi:hypothetical protein